MLKTISTVISTMVVLTRKMINDQQKWLIIKVTIKKSLKTILIITITKMS